MASEVPKSQFVILVGQNSVNYYIQMVVVALLSVVLVGFVIPVSVVLVVVCIEFFRLEFYFFRKSVLIKIKPALSAEVPGHCQGQPEQTLIVLFVFLDSCSAAFDPIVKDNGHPNSLDSKKLVEQT